MNMEHGGGLGHKGRNQVVSNKQRILKAKGLNEPQSRNREVSSIAWRIVGVEYVVASQMTHQEGHYPEAASRP